MYCMSVVVRKDKVQVRKTFEKKFIVPTLLPHLKKIFCQGIFCLFPASIVEVHLVVRH